ncbi:alpha/beta hydrolase family protein [Marinibactrum halimedae]|uniref:Dienelactone hydrolase n=1 Tax=Marinibactrum halimedae TaxID=1444977 RepID=A0AA37T947_9GAMM|nr:hypothetical protein [Marinibactrum halimedae]MCD9460502.1 hypothetical protein [Marinibactrum halimedae]GLS27864.1 hypothetical protein GCM10007877_35830 [Marinibactrum halimedae]
MKHILNLLVFFSVLLSVSFVSASTGTKSFSVKSEEIDFINPQTQEPLKLIFWYPYNTERKCVGAQLCIAKQARFDQGIVLTHGAMGSTRELNWLGYAMASQGFVTVGVNHYGESWAYGQDKVDARRVLEMWRRPKEVSATLDLLEKNKMSAGKVFKRNIDWSNTTAIGFSSGGATVIALAGGRQNPLLMLNYCDSAKAKGDLGCSYLPKNSAPTKPAEEAYASHIDARIARAVALEPAAGHIATKESLSNIKTPVLIIGARNSDFLPFDHHAGFYSRHITTAKLVTLEGDEGHFVFLDTCDHTFKAQGLSLCKDKPGVDRRKVQERLYPHIFSFIYSNPKSLHP